MKKQLVHALSDLDFRAGKVIRRKAAVARDPRLTAIVGPESPCRCDGDVHAVGLGWVELNRVAADPGGTGIPSLAGAVFEQCAVRLPRLAAVIGAQQDPRIASHVEGLGLASSSWLDVPCGVHRHP